MNSTTLITTSNALEGYRIVKNWDWCEVSPSAHAALWATLPEGL